MAGGAPGGARRSGQASSESGLRSGCPQLLPASAAASPIAQSGSASNTRTSPLPVATTNSAASAAGRPNWRELGGCNGPATTGGAGELVGGGVPSPDRNGASDSVGDADRVGLEVAVAAGVGAFVELVALGVLLVSCDAVGDGELLGDAVCVGVPVGDALGVGTVPRITMLPSADPMVLLALTCWVEPAGSAT